MTLDHAFEDHIKLAGRVQTGRPLRAHRHEPVTAQTLADELRALDQAGEFDERTSMHGFEEARYAVDALIDSIADASFKGTWTRRNPDAHIGHNFYTRLIAAYERGPAGRDVLNVYVLCTLLGFTGDLHARSNDKVLRAIAEATLTPLPLSVGWSPVSIVDVPAVVGSHRLFAASAAIAVANYLVWIAMLSGLRLAFGL